MGRLHPACHPATHPCPARRPFRKDKGGGQQCFVFLYKTNDVSQTHEPHHTLAHRNNHHHHQYQHQQLQSHHKIRLRSPRNATQGLVTTVPGPAQASSSFRVCMCFQPSPLLSDLYTDLLASPKPNVLSPQVPRFPGLCPVPTHKALRPVSEIPPTAGASHHKHSCQTMTPTPVGDAPLFSWAREPIKVVKPSLPTTFCLPDAYAVQSVKGYR